MKTFSLQVVAELKSIPSLHRFIENGARELAIGDQEVFDIRLAVEEAVTNTIIHGYAGQAGKIRIELAREGNVVLIQLWDDAKVFDPSLCDPADFSEPLSQRPAGGRGLCLMKGSVDEIRHEATDSGGNHLILAKHLPGDPSPQDPKTCA